MTTRERVWVLAEFVGGPSDGRVLSIEGSTLGEFVAGIVDLASAAPNYRILGTPSDADALDAWAEREHSVISDFGCGSPRYFLQLRWRGHGVQQRARRSRARRPAHS